MSVLEMWAGPECTVNRVGDVWFDQLERSGHAVRLEDLDRLSAMKVSNVRYPVLWERLSNARVSEIDFRWSDERLHRLRELGLSPIVGLVHHGSGPRGTNLLQDDFATGLERYADRIARRYPWVDAYTPINEPLTTARFSGLYGHWYPHCKDARAFVRALLVEIRATRLAMAAIRRVNPAARLVQTEDMGMIYSSSRLRYQADFENERRFLSLDLLAGKVRGRHPLRRYLVSQGANPNELDAWADDPCAPDLIGLNYYVTSDRYLDHHVTRFPIGACGTNGHDVYADVEAVRARVAGITGHAEILNQVWSRYHLPLALTEVHLGSTPEQRVRWLVEAWEGAHDARAAGVDVRAVTSWSVFGAFDWDTLVTQDRGHYEPGAFDLVRGAPVETAVASVVRDLATRGQTSHPLAQSTGWWREPTRLLFPEEDVFDRTAAGATLCA